MGMQESALTLQCSLNLFPRLFIPSVSPSLRLLVFIFSVVLFLLLFPLFLIHFCPSIFHLPFSPFIFSSIMLCLVPLHAVQRLSVCFRQQTLSCNVHITVAGLSGKPFF
jgi:hypothetical protein